MAASAGGTQAPPGGEAEQWLACRQCALPLATAAELIEEKFASWQKVTWAYELGVLGRESTWCYSATNAHDHRFDVVRVLPSALGPSIRCSGEPTQEHSWFPGFSWSMAHCRLCDAHLGWSFSPDGAAPAQGQGPLGRTAPAAPAAPQAPLGPQGLEEPRAEGGEAPGPAARPRPRPAARFLGLVLTKLREEALPREEAERRLAAAERRWLAGAPSAAALLLQELLGGGAARAHGSRLRAVLRSAAASGRLPAAGLPGRPGRAAGGALAAEGPGGDAAPAPEATEAEASGAAA
ncbi:unnamed protein product [Prorocentrum cordatum]|uniref:CULT domain-containing protein n=1 Tax=Prorocentrum cordatum TaxID=2364126 RepID=A0ABN9P849_9DINO|nr:unnamed protein product [Polarella glacialis]